MDRVRWIKYKGKDIIIQDLSKLHSSKPEDNALILKVIEHFKSELTNLKGKKALVLNDVRESYANSETMGALKQLAKYTKENNLVEKECAVGITGAKKFLLQVVNLFGGTNVKPFTDLDKAKDYLVS